MSRLAAANFYAAYDPPSVEGDRASATDRAWSDTWRARDYYTRLIATDLVLTPYGDWYVQSARVVATYGLAADNLRAAGIERGETLGEFYFRGGKIASIAAHFAPSTAAAIESARRAGRL